MKKNRATRIAIAVAAILALAVGIVGALSQCLGNTNQFVYAGKTVQDWQAQLNGHDAVASNEAFTVVNTRVIPQLTEVMFHDTNDSSARIKLIEALNGLPGVQINFIPADDRRSGAAENIGELGPAAKSAVPALIRALEGPDFCVHKSAIKALGNIHSDPDTVIPLLTIYLDIEGLNEEAATALANYGTRAKAAAPKIVRMLHVPDAETQFAARTALLKIDPDAATNAEARKK